MSAKKAKFEKLAAKKKLGSIAKHLKSKDPEIRLDAIYGIGLCGGEDAINLLTNWSNSADPAERKVAFEALGKCGKGYSITQMNYQFFQEQDPELKETIRKAIAEIRERVQEKN